MPASLLSALRARWRGAALRARWRGAALRADTRGAAAVLLALGMPVVIGGLGFGAEIAYWYMNQRKVQDAADAAAYAAAVELRAGGGAEAVAAAAAEAAAGVGFRSDRGTIRAAWPPADGVFRDDPQAVAITVEERLPRLLSGIISKEAVEVAGRSVARVSSGAPTCVLALDPSGRGAVAFTGTGGTIRVACGVHANSSAEEAAVVAGPAAVEAGCLSAAGGIAVATDLALTACPAPRGRAGVAPDPFASLGAPPVPADCAPAPAAAVGAPLALAPGAYCGLEISGEARLDPGTYVFSGDLVVGAGAVLRGHGVTLYFAAGAARLDPRATVRLSAPRSAGDPFAGVLIFAARGRASEHAIGGGPGSAFDGTIYAPDGKVTLIGGAGCARIVARSVVFAGDPGLEADCGEDAIEDVRGLGLIALVE